MKVGWSAEVKPDEWIKIDLDESDLQSLLYTAGFPLDQRALVAPRLAYQLLDVEAQRLVMVKLGLDYGHDVNQVKARVEELLKRRAALFDELMAVASAVESQT